MGLHDYLWIRRFRSCRIDQKAEVFPRTPVYVSPEIISAVGALIADAATLAWLGNLVLTILKGRTANTEGLSIGEVINTVALQLGAPELTGLSNPLSAIKAEELKIKTLFSKLKIKI